jgi:hypothetical protein
VEGSNDATYDVELVLFLLVLHIFVEFLKTGSIGAPVFRDTCDPDVDETERRNGRDEGSEGMPLENDEFS